MPTSLVVERDVEVPVQDGVALATDIYRPAANGKYPVLLQRTPYGKSTAINVASRIFNPLDAVQRGYCVAIQDVRGRFRSGGQWQPFRNEVADGKATADWLSSQPWCDGQIGVYGGSYVGVSALHASLSGATNIKACVVQAFTSSFHDCWTYSGGAFELGFNLYWVAGPFWGLAWDTVQKLGLPEEEVRTIKDQLAAITADPHRACRVLPLSNIPAFEKSARYWKEWQEHPGYDEYWARSDVRSIAKEVTVPVLNIAGWYDIFLLGGLQLQRLLEDRSTPQVRGQHRTVIGPWEHVSHLSLMPSSAGQWEFGAEAISGPRSWTDLTLGFFDKHLRGGTEKWEGGAVRYFMMGENQWRSATSWPPKHQPRKFYLHSFGQANSSTGNGTLSVEEPTNEPRDSYIYDPNDPVPSVGGRTLFYHPKLGMPGVFDQREVEKRDDVLVYTSQRLSTPLKIAGPISVRVFAVSSAEDTDFTAKLVDVDRTGYCANIAEGIIRARYRSDPSREQLLSPGEVNEFEIDLWAVAHSFEVGHRIRLEISSSNFPRFSRNLNSAVNPSLGTVEDITVASQQILHDSNHASHIVLPVVLE